MSSNCDICGESEVRFSIVLSNTRIYLCGHHTDLYRLLKDYGKFIGNELEDLFNDSFIVQFLLKKERDNWTDFSR